MEQLSCEHAHFVTALNPAGKRDRREEKKVSLGRGNASRGVIGEAAFPQPLDY